MSNEFLRSSMCMFEFDVASNLNIKRRKHRFIVIKWPDLDLDEDIDEDNIRDRDRVRLFLSSYTHHDNQPTRCLEQPTEQMYLSQLRGDEPNRELNSHCCLQEHWLINTTAIIEDRNKSAGCIAPKRCVYLTSNRWSVMLSWHFVAFLTEKMPGAIFYGETSGKFSFGGCPECPVALFKLIFHMESSLEYPCELSEIRVLIHDTSLPTCNGYDLVYRF